MIFAPNFHAHKKEGQQGEGKKVKRDQRMEGHRGIPTPNADFAIGLLWKSLNFFAPKQDQRGN